MNAEFADAVQKVADGHNADIYVYAGPFETGDEKRFNDHIIESKSRSNIFLVLTTLGGSADAAYQIVKSVHRHYGKGKCHLFVISLCKSAGTLVALGANEIIMTDTAELGPLDIQVGKPDELGEYVSGLTPTQALDTLRAEAFRTFEDYFLKFRFRSGGQISTRMAADVATKLSIGLFAPIYEQIDPMRLGENARSNLIAVAYGKRIRTGNVKHETIERLVSGYPSHGFAIDRDEAEELFEDVREPNDAELCMASYLRGNCYKCATEPGEAVIECISKPHQSSDPQPAAENNDNAHTTLSAGDGEIPESTVQGDRHTSGESLTVTSSANAANRNAGKAKSDPTTTQSA